MPRRSDRDGTRFASVRHWEVSSLTQHILESLAFPNTGKFNTHRNIVCTYLVPSLVFSINTLVIAALANKDKLLFLFPIALKI